MNLFNGGIKLGKQNFLGEMREIYKIDLYYIFIQFINIYV